MCGYNLERSVMLANELSDSLKNKANVESRGLYKPIKKIGSPNSENFLGLFHQDKFSTGVSMHHATPVTQQEINNAHLILVHTLSQKNKVLTIAPESKNRVFLVKEMLEDGHDLKKGNLDIRSYGSDEGHMRHSVDAVTSGILENVKKFLSI